MAGIKDIAKELQKKYPDVAKPKMISIVEDAFKQVPEFAIHNPVRVGIGTFRITETKERLGRNPRTGEIVTVPIKKILKFKSKR
jgi:DNA-binding protein HU-beta